MVILSRYAGQIAADLRSRAHLVGNAPFDVFHVIPHLPGNRPEVSLLSEREFVAVQPEW